MLLLIKTMSYYSFTTQMTRFIENIGMQNCSTSDTTVLHNFIL